MKPIVVNLDKVSEAYDVEIVCDGKARREKFFALKDVTLAIPQGQAVAVVGANGAGKSTLLRLIAGLLEPDEGTVKVSGRVGSLMDLGAGFHPELTGRDNLLLNASLYNFSKPQINERLDDILKFADIGTFIDAPLRCYSQGMYVRLAFSLAIHIDPDILLVDDCLAVGDKEFQLKCFDKILELKDRQATIVFVTHDMNLAREICERGVYVRKGEIAADGDIAEVVQAYAAPIAVDRSVFKYLGAQLDRADEERRRQEEEEKERRREFERQTLERFERQDEERRRAWEEEKLRQDEERRREWEEEVGRQNQQIEERSRQREEEMRRQDEERRREWEAEVRQRNEELRLQWEEEMRRQDEERRREWEAEVRQRNEELRLQWEEEMRRQDEERRREWEAEVRRQEEEQRRLQEEEEERRKEHERRAVERLLKKEEIKRHRQGPLEVFFDNGRIRIFHKNIELTSPTGFQTVFRGFDGEEYASGLSHTRLRRVSDSETVCFVKWGGALRPFQFWRVRLEEDFVEIEVIMQLRRRKSVCHERVHLALTDACAGSVRRLDETPSDALATDGHPALTFVSSLGRQVTGVFPGPDKAPTLYFMTVPDRESYLAEQPEKFRYEYFKGRIQVGKSAKIKSGSRKATGVLLSGNLEAVFEDGHFQLKWKGRPVTVCLGVYTALCSRGVWHDSSKALWTLKESSGQKIVAEGFWPWRAVSQRWEMATLGDGGLRWTVSMEVHRRELIDIEETALMVGENYDRWSAGPDSGVFPPEFTSDDYFRYCVWAGRPDGAAAVALRAPKAPAVVFKPTAAADHRIFLESTSHIGDTRARLIHFLKVRPRGQDLVEPGEFGYFQGDIFVIEKESL